MLLEGQVAIVTGSTRGIGRAIALELARRGARVVVNGRAPSGAAEECLAASDRRGVVIYRQADVDDADPVPFSRLNGEVVPTMGFVVGTRGAQSACALPWRGPHPRP